MRQGLPEKQGLYDPQFEHDACGVGFVCQMKGKRSHEIVEQALTILVNLDHRGACGCEANTGDGAGILLQLPHRFLSKVAGASRVFTSASRASTASAWSSARAIRRHVKPAPGDLHKIVVEQGQQVIGWRDIPTDNSSLGATAQATEPFMRQVFIRRGANCADDQAFERKLYIIRKYAHAEIRTSKADDAWYCASLSCRTCIYKGMLMPEQVDKYYPDLRDPDMDSALALVHSRFSTNTFPSWERSHPYRYIAHNGEINTLRGNINWMKARESLLQSDLFGADLKKIFPIVNTNGSDSAMFDNVFELLVMGGRSLPHAMMMMIPEPWAGHESMSDEKKAFYEYHSCLMEPWDGPASVAFTDGKMIGATLDRNGLRPSRYYVTKDDLVIMASEAGVLPVAPERVASKGRLQPGRMFLVDMEQGRIVADEEIKNSIAAKHPYREWLDQNLVELAKVKEAPEVPLADHETILQRQQAFGYTFEDQRMLLLPMAKDGVEAVGSMGTDIPLAVLSDKSKLLYDYFKQLFAQVTNPPIDCIREEIVTSADTTIGPERNLLEPTPESCHLIELKSPILTNEELAKLKHLAEGQFRSVTIPILFNPQQGAAGLEKAMQEICAQADRSITGGVNIIILSDRGVDKAQRRRPSAPRRRRPAPSSHPRGQPHPGRPRSRIGRAARSAPLLRAHRLRLRGDQSLPRLRDAR